MKNVLCVIQARYGSKRLPGKMLMKLGDETLLERAWRIACEAFGKENCVIAVPYDCDSWRLKCEGARFFPSHAKENDVLGRFYDVAYKNRSYETIFRYTPDDPFKNPEMMRRVANGERGIPVEIGGETFTFAQLKEAHETITDAFHREHIGYVFSPDAPPPPEGVWTIDTPEQLAECRAFLNAQEVSV